MDVLFYIAAVVAVISSVLVITRRNAVHALLYLITSLLSAAFIFYLLGAPFIAALEVMIYAGAIMVLFIFVVMMLNLGRESEEQERNWMTPRVWIGPSFLVAILLIEFIIMLYGSGNNRFNSVKVTPNQVGYSLFTTYVLGVELTAMLLVSGIVGAYHIGRKKRKMRHRYLEGTDE
jgi:NADH-quinone oxidoreductase subunit J